MEVCGKEEKEEEFTRSVADNERTTDIRQLFLDCPTWGRNQTMGIVFLPSIGSASIPRDIRLSTLGEVVSNEVSLPHAVAFIIACYAEALSITVIIPGSYSGSLTNNFPPISIDVPEDLSTQELDLALRGISRQQVHPDLEHIYDWFGGYKMSVIDSTNVVFVHGSGSGVQLLDVMSVGEHAVVLRGNYRLLNLMVTRTRYPVHLL